MTMDSKVVCPLCGSRDTEFRTLRSQVTDESTGKLLLKAYFDKIGIPFAEGMRQFNREVHQCNDCQLHFIHPMYDDVALDTLYSNYSTPTDGSDHTETRQTFVEQNRDAIVARQNMIVRFNLDGRAGMSVLDVGSYKGVNHVAFSTFGFDTHGIELSRSAAEFCMREIADESKVCIGNFAHYQFEKTFELITMHHVIEHVTDLHQFIAKARATLTDDGLLIIETPLYEFHTTDNRNGRFIDIYHTLFFTSTGLVQLMNEHNFSLEDMYPIYFSMHGNDSHIYGCYLFKKRQQTPLKRNFTTLCSKLEEHLVSRINNLIELRGKSPMAEPEYTSRLRAIFPIIRQEQLRTVLYGINGMGTVALRMIEENPGFPLHGIVDRALTGEKFMNYPVLHPEQLRTEAPDVIILAAGKSGPAIHEQLGTLIDDNTFVLPLYDLGHPAWSRFTDASSGKPH